MKADVNSKKRDGVLKNLTSGLVEGMIKDGNCQTRSDSTPNLDVNMETVASLVGRFDTEVDGSRNDVKMEDSGEESGVSDSELEDGEVLSCESEVEEEEEEEEVKETFPTPSGWSGIYVVSSFQIHFNHLYIGFIVYLCMFFKRPTTNIHLWRTVMVRRQNSTTAKEVSRFQWLFPNPSWLVWKGIPPS